MWACTAMQRMRTGGADLHIYEDAHTDPVEGPKLTITGPSLCGLTPSCRDAYKLSHYAASISHFLHEYQDVMCSGCAYKLVSVLNLPPEDVPSGMETRPDEDGKRVMTASKARDLVTSSTAIEAVREKVHEHERDGGSSDDSAVIVSTELKEELIEQAPTADLGLGSSGLSIDEYPVYASNEVGGIEIVDDARGMIDRAGSMPGMSVGATAPSEFPPTFDPDFDMSKPFELSDEDRETFKKKFGPSVDFTLENGSTIDLVESSRASPLSQTKPLSGEFSFTVDANDKMEELLRQTSDDSAREDADGDEADEH